jgi:hypothetical protein
MVRKKELQRAGVVAAKEMLQMDFIADEFAISDDTSNLHLLNFPTRTNDLIFGVCHARFIEVEIDLKRHVLSASHLIALFSEQVVRLISYDGSTNQRTAEFHHTIPFRDVFQETCRNVAKKLSWREMTIALLSGYWKLN